jgi:hypothetical protein
MDAKSETIAIQVYILKLSVKGIIVSFTACRAEYSVTSLFKPEIVT